MNIGNERVNDGNIRTIRKLDALDVLARGRAVNPAAVENDVVCVFQQDKIPVTAIWTSVRARVRYFNANEAVMISTRDAADNLVLSFNPTNSCHHVAIRSAIEWRPAR